MTKVLVLLIVALLTITNSDSAEARYTTLLPDGPAWQAHMKHYTENREQNQSTTQLMTLGNNHNADLRLVHHREGHVRAKDVPNGGGLKGYAKGLWKKITDPSPDPEPLPTGGPLPSQLTFNGFEGGQDPAAQVLTITNTGTGTLDWSASDDASWLSLSPSSGSTTTEADFITVTAAIDGLTASDYTASITLTAPGATNSPQLILVTLTVMPPPPSVGHSPASLTFTGVEGGGNPAPQTLYLNNTGEGTLTWNADDDAPWLDLSPAFGTTTTETDEVTLTVDTAGLGSNLYSASVTITAPGASNTPQQVPVTLVVTEVQSTSVTLSWDPNSENDLSGYMVYLGTASGSYRNPVDVGNVTSFDVLNVTEGHTYFFAIKAYDTSTNLSEFSNEVFK